ncbi:hypothetical protein [Streptomyces sp. NPDC002851]
MKARRALTAAAITTGLVLAVAGCGSDDGGAKKNANSEATASAKDDEKGGERTEPDGSAEDKVLGESQGSKASITINSAVRDEGGFLTVGGTVKNTSGSFWNPASWSGDEKELSSNGASMAGASLVDTSGKKRYLILRDTEGRCLCTQFQGGLKPDEEKVWFAQFPAPPASATEVEFQLADMPPATIELSEGE